MKNLNFGCRRSEFLVTSSKEDWFIQCRFYEHGREKPFTYRRKLNRFKSETERKKIEKLLLKQMTELIDEKDYNPRTKQFMFKEGQINQYSNVEDSLREILKKKEFTSEHKMNVELHLGRFLEALSKLD